MTVTEQPVQTASENAPAPESSPQTTVRKRMVREMVIAVSVLLGVLTAVLVYFFANTKPAADNTNSANTAITTAEWLHPTASADDGNIVAAGSEAVEAANGEVPSNEESTASEEDDEETLAPNDVKTGTVKSGEPVIKSLQSFGLSLQKAHQVISALDGVFDFRQSRPGDAFELKVDGKGEPRYFAYHASLTEVYEVRRQGDTLKGRKKNIPTTFTEKRFGGTIASSLYKSLQDAGAHPSLAGKMADILSNEVDFFKEQRPGDTFRVIVAEETLGDTFLGYGPVLALEYKGVKSGMKRFFRFETKGRQPEYFSDRGISQPRSVIAIPLHYTRISSRFGMRYHPVLKRKRLHNGVDFAASTGTPVWACAEGEVVIAGRYGANGNLVGIRHDDNLQSFYAHLHKFAPGIKKGTHVRRRQVIGYVGNTGRSTGSHLHFGLKKGNTFIDPLKYKVQPGRPIEARYRKALKTVIRTLGRTLDSTAIKPPTEPLAEAPESDNEVLGLEDW